MSKRLQIIFITPIFVLSATISCILFAKLDRQHREKVAQDEINQEMISLKGLDDNTKEKVRDVVNKLAYSSRFSLSWNRKFVSNYELISSEKVSGFDLISFLLLDEQLDEELTLVKNQMRQYTKLLVVISESLIREYESVHFFERAKRFASCIGLEEGVVLKVLKEGIEALKCDGDLTSIAALIDFFHDARHSSSQFSFSLL